MTLVINQLNKVYPNGTVALKDVNFTVKKGEFITILGPSGCGKSTILRLIAGLGKISSGSIEGNEQQLKSKLAFVFQESALMPWATVAENIRLPLKLSGVPRHKSQPQLTEIIQLVGLEGFEDAYPRQLSGGMKMRVSIARALVTNPSIILMDEPFGALDEMTRTKLNSELLKLWEQQQPTIIFVTHNIYEAIYLSNRVLVMDSRPGRIIAEISIEVPLPRHEDFRTSRLFNEYYQQIFAHLQKAVLS